MIGLFLRLLKGGRTRSMDPLQVSMTGVRMGERFLLIGCHDRALPFDSGDFDMIVIDDTNGSFAAIESTARLDYLRDTLRVVRQGGRIEVVEGLGGGGLLRGAVVRPQGYDLLRDLATAGFKPSRLLAEKDGFRFLEGLRPNI